MRDRFYFGYYTGAALAALLYAALFAIDPPSSPSTMLAVAGGVLSALAFAAWWLKR